MKYPTIVRGVASIGGVSTMYRVKDGSTEVCGACGTVTRGGGQMIRLTSLYGERLGNCCLECYELEDENDDMEERWG